MIDSFGADRIMVGFDYPFQIMDPDPIGSVSKLELDQVTMVARYTWHVG